MLDKNYRLLFVESKLSRYQILKDLLQNEFPDTELVFGQSIDCAIEKTDCENFDGILLNVASCHWHEKALHALIENKSDAPVVIITEMDSETIHYYLSQGVSDYIIKGDINAGNLLKTFHHNIERRKAKRQIRNSENKYKSLFNYNPMPMWVLDKADLKFLSVNKAATELYGYSEEEFLRMNVRDLWTPDQEEHVEKVVSANRDGYFNLKVRHLTKAGLPIDVEVKSNPLIYEGRSARVSLVNDITERVKFENKIAESEKRFKALVQEGSDIISILNCENRYVYNSPSCFSIYGISAEDLSDHDFFEFIHQDDRDKLLSEFQKLKVQSRRQFSSYRIITADQKIRWIETIATNLVSDPVINGVVLNSRDITEFIEQEIQIKHSLERFNIVSKATSDLITDYDVQNDVMHFSESVTEMFGYPIDEVGKSGSWWNENIHPEDYIKIKPIIEEMTEKGLKNLTVEYRFKCFDGSYKFILDRSYLIADEHNKALRIIGSMQDITERKLHIMQVESHNKRLREIAWTQSHVVRAPLAKVMGLVDLMKNYKNDIDNFDEVMENVLNSANELDQIIRKIAKETEKEL